MTDRKSRPVWMTESTIITEDITENGVAILTQAAQSSTQPTILTLGSSSNNARGKKENEDIMSVLLQHEKQPGKNEINYKGMKIGSSNANSSDSSDEDKDIENTKIRKLIQYLYWRYKT